MNERPQTDLISNVVVIDGDDFPFPWVEVFMEIHRDGDACEPLTAEFFPYGRPKDLDSPETVSNAPEAEPCVRLLQPAAVNVEEAKRFKKLAAVVGRLTYYDWMQSDTVDTDGC